MDNIEYSKNGEIIISNNQSVFVYETCIYVYHNNLFGLVNSELHTSSNPIPGIVSSYWKTRNIQICCSLYSAPEKWLQDNGYKRYVFNKKKRKKKNEQKNNTNKSENRSNVSSTNST